MTPPSTPEHLSADNIARNTTNRDRQTAALEATPQTASKARPWLRLLGSAITFVLLGYIVNREEGWRHIWETAQALSWWQIALAFTLIGLSRFATALRWHYLLRAVEIPTTFRDSLSLTFAGLYSSNFLPTTIGGDVVRLMGARRLGYAGSPCMASLVLDRGIGLLGMASAVAIGFPAISGLFIHGASESLPLMGGIALPKGKALVQKGRDLAAKVLDAFATGMRRPRYLLTAFGMTWLHQVCLFGAIAIILAGLGHPLPFRSVLGLWSVVYVVTLLPISVNGLGVQELTVVYTFTHLGGLSTAASAGMALLIRVLMTLASIPGVLAMPSVTARVKQNNIDPVPVAPACAYDITDRKHHGIRRPARRRNVE